MILLIIKCLEFSDRPHTIQTQEHSHRAVPLHEHTYTVHQDPQFTTRPKCAKQITMKKKIYTPLMCQFLQGKAAPIRHRSHECRRKKKLFHTGHLTSRPLQNYPPQPQGRDCWERNQLIAAPCCYRVLGTLSFSAQNIKLLKGLWMRCWCQV